MPSPAELPTRVYKLCKAERLEGVLEGLVRLTQADALNDPFELQPVFSAQETSRRLLDEVFDQTPALLREGLRARLESLPLSMRSQLPDIDTMVSMMCTNRNMVRELSAAKSLMDQMMTSAFRDIRDTTASTLRHKIGILSLTEDPLNVVMWSHYGDNHTGVAIEFDARHRWFNRPRTQTDEFLRLRPVNYVDLSLRDRTFPQVAEENLLLTKSVEWAYEREWRLLAPVADATQTIKGPHEHVHLFRLNLKSIVSVIFGMRTRPDNIKRTADLIESRPHLSHIRLKRTKQRPEAASLELVPL